MATQSLTQVWDPVAKQYVSVTGTGGVMDVAITGGVTVTGGATEAKQDAGNTLLTDIDANTDGLEGYLDGVEGKLDTTNSTLSAISTALVSGTTRYSSIGANVSATIKSGAGKIWSLSARIAAAGSQAYLWVWDSTTTSGAVIIPPIPLGPGGLVVIGTDYFTEDSDAFATGLTYGFSVSDTAYSAYGTAGHCQITALYT